MGVAHLKLLVVFDNEENHGASKGFPKYNFHLTWEAQTCNKLWAE